MLYWILALLVSAPSVFASTDAYLSKWTQFRLTELFTINQTSNMNAQDQFFSETAWNEFQQSLANSHILEIIKDGGYQVTLTQFIKPVEISKGEHDNQHYAQSTFLIKFSNSKSSWVQPIEMILTLEGEDYKQKITQFEGIASKPIHVKNFAYDHAKQCKS